MLIDFQQIRRTKHPQEGMRTQYICGKVTQKSFIITKKCLFFTN